MNEQEILHAIMQDTQTGWWQANYTDRRFYVSDLLGNLLGISSEGVGFDELHRFFPALYLKRASMETSLFDVHFPHEHVVSVKTSCGTSYLSWKVLSCTKDSGADVVTGYASRISAPQEERPEANRAEELLHRFNGISNTLLSLLRRDKVEETVDRILYDILTLFHGDRAYIIECDWVKRVHRCTYEVTVEGVDSERNRLNALPMDDVAWWTQEIRDGRSIVLSSLDDLPAEAAGERAILAEQDIRSLIVLPLFSRDKVWGYAGVDVTRQVRTWSEEDCRWFASLANIIGLCLELHRSEQKAQDDRSYLEGLYRHMPLGYVQMRILHNERGVANGYRVTDANAAADALLGISRDSYVGCESAAMGWDTTRILPVLLSALGAKKYVETDARLATVNRDVHVVLYSIRPDEVICLLTDMTEVHEAHTELARKEVLLRNIFDNVQVGIELYSAKGHLLDINNKDMEIFGIRDKSDVLGIDFYANPLIPADVREGVRRGERQSFSFAYPFDKLGGYYASEKTGLLEVYTTINMLYNSKGRVDNFLVMNIDDTEISRAHSRLAEFESSFSLVSRLGKVGYCRFDLLTKEGYGVPQWYCNLGEEPETPLPDILGIYNHVHPSDRDTIVEIIGRVKEGSVDNFSLDLRINPGLNQTWTRINVMRNPLNNDPSKLEMVCVNYDITELKAVEYSLIEAKNKAEVSDRLKSAFLANMSHEIRTPLNAIVGFSNLMSETEDPAERRSYIQIVQENNELLIKLISDILDLSKIEAGTFEFNFGVVDADQMCEEVVRSLGLKFQGSAVELLFCRHDAQVCFFGDKNRLMQVVINFLNNALKFTSEGSVTLDYAVVGDEILFSVEDTGTGIPEEKLHAVFQRFVKLDSFVQGTGLGLSICKSIVEQMGGRIGAESEVGRGSRFWFSVPMGLEHLQDDFAAMPQVEHAATRVVVRADGERPRLLVAEDTDSNFLLVSLMLRKEYEILHACNGEEAVRMCREEHPDVVLMDIQMPVMDGLEAMRLIRDFDKELPIIAVTAFAYDQDRQKAFDAGCSNFLTKPLTGDTLRQALREVLK